jgi:hypothetical protein
MGRVMTTPRDDKVHYLVTLEGDRRPAGDTAHAHALRFLLKHLLRSRGLRCIDAREISNEGGERS